MRPTNLLAATAFLFAFACTKSDQTSADSVALAAKNLATLDSISAAEQANATMATTMPGDTTPARTAAAPVATTTGRSSSTGRPSAGSSGTPKGTAVATTTAKPTVPDVKTGAVAPVVTSKGEVKPAVSGGATGAVAVGANVQDSQGKTLYEANCRKCHGVLGVPPKAMKAKYPKLATFDAAFFAKHSNDSVVTVLTKGTNEDMKSFKDKLSHDQMVAVAAYIRSLSK